MRDVDLLIPPAHHLLHVLGTHAEIITTPLFTSRSSSLPFLPGLGMSFSAQFGFKDITSGRPAGELFFSCGGPMYYVITITE
jgi:hypothetical protein